MPAGSEIEIKLAISDHRLFELIPVEPELLALLHQAGPVTRTFEALYYDTPHFLLQEKGFAYRVRHEGSEWVATVKSDQGSSGGLFAREEWNEPVSGPDPCPVPFAQTHVGDRLALAMGQEKLQLLFSTRFARTVLQLQTAGGTQIEMALDRGTIWSGTDGIPISELELELKAGSVSELLMLAAWIAARWHLLPEIRSKYARGLELLQTSYSANPDIHPQLANATISDPTPVALVNACVNDIFCCQAKTLGQRLTPEIIRELRIQCRRLRSVLKIFQPTFDKDAARLHSERLRQWGSLLGSVRDIDVLVNSLKKFNVHFRPVFTPSVHWQDTINDRRDFLAEDILHRICQGELTQHLFELQGWVYREQEKQTGTGGAAERAANILVNKMLTGAIKKLREDVRKAEGILDAKILHQLRLRTKQLRYIQEALNRIPRYRDDEFTAALKNIQSHLGKIHDTVQIKSLLDQLETGNPDENFLLEKELFLNWRNRDTLECFSNLPRAAEMFRQAAKSRLRTLPSLRAARGAKPGHDSGPHEPRE